jgi:hypothetical protein
MITSLHYHSNKFSTIQAHIYGGILFSLYQRTFLWTLSELSWVNLNFVLCGNESDPFFKRIGKWYYLFSEFYLPVGNFFIKQFMYHTARYVRIAWLLHASKHTPKSISK